MTGRKKGTPPKAKKRAQKNQPARTKAESKYAQNVYMQGNNSGSPKPQR